MKPSISNINLHPYRAALAGFHLRDSSADSSSEDGAVAMTASAATTRKLLEEDDDFVSSMGLSGSGKARLAFNTRHTLSITATTEIAIESDAFSLKGSMNAAVGGGCPDEVGSGASLTPA